MWNAALKKQHLTGRQSDILSVCAHDQFTFNALQSQFAADCVFRNTAPCMQDRTYQLEVRCADDGR